MATVQRSIQIWLLFILPVLLSGWFAFINLHEFIIIGILQQTADYPFGGEGPTPWYYKTAQLYAAVSLIFGLLFLAVFVTCFLAFARNEKKFLIIMIAVSLFFIFIELIMGQVP